jgi:hypothetical protein
LNEEEMLFLYKSFVKPTPRSLNRRKNLEVKSVLKCSLCQCREAQLATARQRGGAQPQLAMHCGLDHKINMLIYDKAAWYKQSKNNRKPRFRFNLPRFRFD